MSIAPPSGVKQSDNPLTKKEEEKIKVKVDVVKAGEVSKKSLGNDSGVVVAPLTKKKMSKQPNFVDRFLALFHTKKGTIAEKSNLVEKKDSIVIPVEKVDEDGEDDFKIDENFLDKPFESDSFYLKAQDTFGEENGAEIDDCDTPPFLPSHLKDSKAKSHPSLVRISGDNETFVENLENYKDFEGKYENFQKKVKTRTPYNSDSALETKENHSDKKK